MDTADGHAYLGCDLRDERVAQGTELSHSSGNPMSHATHVGFSEPIVLEGFTAPPSKLFTGTVPFRIEFPVSL